VAHDDAMRESRSSAVRSGDHRLAASRLVSRRWIDRRPSERWRGRAPGRRRSAAARGSGKASGPRPAIDRVVGRRPALPTCTGTGRCAARQSSTSVTTPAPRGAESSQPPRG
jgi:hypothetical protein